MPETSKTQRVPESDSGITRDFSKSEVATINQRKQHETPDGSCRGCPSENRIELLPQNDLRNTQQFVEANKVDSDASSMHESQEAAVADKPENSSTKVSYITVKEVWDKKLYEYTLRKTSATPEIDEHDKYLFVVRIRTDRSTQKPIKYVDIKSSNLQALLAHVLEGVRGVSLKEDKPTIELKTLFNFIPEMREYYEVKLNTAIPSYAITLLEYLETEHHMVQSRLHSLLKDVEITYDLLWTIFKPNTDILTKCPGTGVSRCVRCNFGEERTRNNGTKYFYVEARCLDHDGAVFGEGTIVLPIEEFRGAKPINTLSSYPLAYHQQYEQIKEQLIENGKKFVSLIGVHHRAYSGKAFYFDREGKLIIKSIDKSRIMVDRSLFRRCNPNYKIKTVEPTWVFSDGIIDLSTLLEYGDDSLILEGAPLQAVKESSQALQEQDYLICNSSVFGYSLTHKLWLEFAVNNIHNIVWDQSSFQSLAIPDKRKKAVQALCEAHLGRNPDPAFEDFVAGKGRGLIALLQWGRPITVSYIIFTDFVSGPPGVGKTLTAETISEHLRRPFYTVSAGDLGTDPAQLERNLTEIFDLSTAWNATLLLDEADIFVERRSFSDLHRNALVCIFLRKLEYYDGILFMTTNRVKVIDEAFATRIHMPLRYDELNKDARKKVWVNQLRKAVTKYGIPACHDEDINCLARKSLNGREITNAVSMAHAFAAFDHEVVNISHLNDALELHQQFQADFKGTGFFENQKAYT